MKAWDWMRWQHLSVRLWAVAVVTVVNRNSDCNHKSTLDPESVEPALSIRWR